MNILIDHPDLTIDRPVLTERSRCSFALELTTMKGEVRRVVGNISLRIPNDREQLPEHPTLRDLVIRVLKRQHPMMEYIAEANGVKVVGYYEHPNPRPIGIEYDGNGMACRLYL